jgi:hypothetical protein
MESMALEAYTFLLHSAVLDPIFFSSSHNKYISPSSLFWICSDIVHRRFGVFNYEKCKSIF